MHLMELSGKNNIMPESITRIFGYLKNVNQKSHTTLTQWFKLKVNLIPHFKIILAP